MRAVGSSRPSCLGRRAGARRLVAVARPSRSRRGRARRPRGIPVGPGDGARRAVRRIPLSDFLDAAPGDRARRGIPNRRRAIRGARRRRTSGCCIRDTTWAGLGRGRERGLDRAPVRYRRLRGAVRGRCRIPGRSRDARPASRRWICSRWGTMAPAAAPARPGWPSSARGGGGQLGGRNRYGHPSPGHARRGLQAAATAVWRTDRDGTSASGRRHDDAGDRPCVAGRAAATFETTSRRRQRAIRMDLHQRSSRPSNASSSTGATVPRGHRGTVQPAVRHRARAPRSIAAAIRRAGLVNILGAAEAMNVQGEMQQKLDVLRQRDPQERAGSHRPGVRRWPRRRTRS